MKFKPLSNRVLVEAVEDVEKATKSGIVLPDTANGKQYVKGTVVAIGPGKFTDSGGQLPLSVKIGDVAIFEKYSGTEITIENNKYIVVREDEILGIE